LRDLVKVIKVLNSEPKAWDPIKKKNRKDSVEFIFIKVPQEFNPITR